MLESAYKITLDIHEINSQHLLFCKQGDTRRSITATLIEESELYHISEDCTAAFVAVKPDGKVIFNEARIEGNTIIYDFTPQTCNVPGRMMCELRLYGYDNAQITSPSFSLQVHPAIDTTVVESATEVNVLTGLISEANALIDSVNEKLDKGEFIPKLSIGAVATLPAGSNATATFTGTVTAPVLNLGIPQGPEGQAETLIPDTELSLNSTKPVQNKVIKAALDRKADKAETEAALAEKADGTETRTALSAKSDKAETEAALAGKVDKVSGKGLSTNDFTTALKSKLSGIEAGANNYVLPEGGVGSEHLANAAVTAEKIAAGAVSRLYTAVLGTVWSGTEAPYTQTLLVAGLPDSDRILADLVTGDNWQAEEEAYAAITKMEASAGSITVYAREKTETPLQLRLLVIHGSGLGSGGNSGSGGDTGGSVSTDGLVLVDRSTGAAYTLCVNNGELTMM